MKTQSNDTKISTEDSFSASRQTILGEIWKEHPIHTSIELSNQGRVRRIYKTKEPRVLKPWVNGGGRYLVVKVKVDGRYVNRYVHRLVLETFTGPGEVCLHLDNDPTNNSLENLQWGTAADNNAQTRREGRHGYAVRPALTQEQANYILGSKLPYKILAKIFGVHINTIKRIRRGITKSFKQRKDTQRDISEL